MTVFRILMVILGVVLLAPGLCFLTFGAGFATSMGGPYFDATSLLIVLAMLAIGGLICWGAVLLIINYIKPRR